MKVYHLQTKRVRGLNDDSTPKIEQIVVKLEGEANLQKYCKFMLYNGFVKTDPPRIIDVLEREGAETVKLSGKELKDYIEKGQSIVDNILKSNGNANRVVDYKAEFEKQLKVNNDLELRLRLLEDKNNNKVDEKRASLIEKANELQIKFAKNTSSDKLLEKIQEVEPLFKL